MVKLAVTSLTPLSLPRGVVGAGSFGVIDCRRVDRLTVTRRGMDLDINMKPSQPTQLLLVLGLRNLREFGDSLCLPHHAVNYSPSTLVSYAYDAKHKFLVL